MGRGANMMEPLASNNHKKKRRVALCLVLVETKMARDKRIPQLVMVSNQLLATRIYKVTTSLCEKEWKTSTLAISHYGADSNRIKQIFALMTCSPSVKEVNTLRLRSAGNKSL